MSEQAEIEKISFKIELYATFWDKPPIVEVFVNNDSQHKSEITGSEKEPTVIKFTKDLKAGEKYTLKFARTGKIKGQTIYRRIRI